MFQDFMSGCQNFFLLGGGNKTLACTVLLSGHKINIVGDVRQGKFSFQSCFCAQKVCLKGSRGQEIWPAHTLGAISIFAFPLWNHLSSPSAYWSILTMLFYEYFVKCVVSGISGNNVTFCVRKQRLMFLKDFFQLYISINLHWICIKRQQPKSRRLKKIPLLHFLKICFKTVLGGNDYYSWEVSLN